MTSTPRMSGTAPPVLSTPATNILEGAFNISASTASPRSNLSDERLHIVYEIEYTLAEIKRYKYSRVALQFPDHMLPDAPRVFAALSKGSAPDARQTGPGSYRAAHSFQLEQSLKRTNLSDDDVSITRFYILGDTSYGACCVDEIAAEHVAADAVVHYGRACLSPTARIPVIHVFTVQPISSISGLVQSFMDVYKDKREKVVLIADVTYQGHLPSILEELRTRGYTDIYLAEVCHDPSSPLPNRTVPLDTRSDSSRLHTWHIFHVSDPPQSLLLTLASRVASIRIYPTSSNDQNSCRKPILVSTGKALNRRYALVTSVSTVSIFGILINTLSVKHYLHIVENVKGLLHAAGKKSYTFVVGKINAAKVANFSEVGAWVVIGCWESSLIDSEDYWKPIVTPYELGLALEGDDRRVWTGKWSSDFQKILDEPLQPSNGSSTDHKAAYTHSTKEDKYSEYESAPPEFDLRTGQYVAHTRPMEVSKAPEGVVSLNKTKSRASLIKREGLELARVGGGISPAAEHLRAQRTWRGLGSDFEIAYEEAGSRVEEGRSGIAKGYTHGHAQMKT
ncbi:Diphthamide biosynthesis protein 2 [Puttea exsequens]|nr:Diphthamide biosynthesis protein 2 [Puttea exsequens]